MNPGAEENDVDGHYDICLVSMPYAGLTVPSLALGLLKSILTNSGFKVKVIHANLLFAKQIGVLAFNSISHQLPMALMTGEWSFSTSAFPDISRNDDSYLNAFAHLSGYKEDAGQFREKLSTLRNEAELFVLELAKVIIRTGAKIVGCTSTFEQHVPSLAILKRLKADAPYITTMMGGANCEADMGLATHRNFTWVDYLVSGEADDVIVELCRNILAMGTDVPENLLPKGVLGPCHRLQGSNPCADRIKFYELDKLPVPDFSDYFATLRETVFEKHIKPGLPLETSRGCWWGAMHHCTFCGLNGNGMGYRSKSPAKVLQEIEMLESQYNISSFEVVDNILDMGYFNTLLPELAKQPLRNLFYEVKSNLSRDKVIELKKAGINWIQPGIENLHSSVLELMNKGVKGWQNIQLLKWCREFGVRLSWSILFKFPGEKEEWYSAVAEWIPLLEHLQPPSGMIPLRFDRFSVYHTKAAEFGLDLLPFSALKHIYNLPDVELKDLAYFFINRGGYDPFGIADQQNPIKKENVIYDSIAKKIHAWKHKFWQHISPILSIEEKDDSVIIIDTRGCSKKFRNILTGLSRAIVLACNSAPLTSGLVTVLQNDFDHSPTQSELEVALKVLKDYGYILEIDGRYVSLCVAGNIPSLPQTNDFPGGHLTNAKEAEINPGKNASVNNKDFVKAKDLVASFGNALLLDSGKQLPGFSLTYQAYGVLNEERNNAILVLHPFTKNAHLAGRYSDTDAESGWWDKLVGPDKPLDTRKYHIICSNVLGGSGGSTGPSSINPLTGVPYAMDFPVITIGDMVNAQKQLMDSIGIKKWGGIIGGCFGGEQALEWLARYPESVGSAVIISTTAATSAHTLALSKLMRNQICADPFWNNGNYYGKEFPVIGLTQSILSAIPIWMSREAMRLKFDRRRVMNDKGLFTFEPDFEIERFMDEVGANARKDFDPNSLLYLSRAAEYFDLPYYYGSLDCAFRNVSCPSLFISYKSDWRYPPKEVDQIHAALLKLGKSSEHLVIDHPFGHGAFVFDPSGFAAQVTEFWRKIIL